jgi:cytidyltransferase-like protein
MSTGRRVVVSDGFDDLRARGMRLLEEAARLGEVTVLVWPDEMLERLTGQRPKFPLGERCYMLEAVRYVTRVLPTPAHLDINCLPDLGGPVPDIWVDEEKPENHSRRSFCEAHNLEYCVLPASQMLGFAPPPPMPTPPGRKKVVATGCFDWFHSGHVRFCEQLSAYGDLYVILGHDANIRLLKGEGHPLLPQQERRYAVGSIRYVKEALISSGDGWLDAEPEIRRLKPDIYAVNEDGDRGGKREYCAKMGLEYLVLQRIPAPGLPHRSSTSLRGF